LADTFAPLKLATRRPRQSDPWFDAECRTAKRLTRRLDRAAAADRRRGATAAADDAAVAWLAQRRAYRDIRRRERESFWQSTVDVQRSNPKRLGQSIDTVLGRGRPPDCGEIGADTFQAYFEDKVAAVRAGTESAPSPVFVPGPPGVSLLAFDPVDCRKVADVIRQLYRTKVVLLTRCRRLC